jgi:hypothetical protein
VTKTVARLVAQQLRYYGKVITLNPHAGTFYDKTGRVWSWSVFGRMVEFTRDGWRTRQVTVDKVAKYMFEWLIQEDESRAALDFTLNLDSLVKIFGKDGAYQAFLKYRGAA